jgi:hypothetical protein
VVFSIVQRVWCLDIVGGFWDCAEWETVGAVFSVGGESRGWKSGVVW